MNTTARLPESGKFFKYSCVTDKDRLRVFSKLGDGDLTGASEINARAKFCRDATRRASHTLLAGGDFARACISPESPKLETPCRLDKGEPGLHYSGFLGFQRPEKTHMLVERSLDLQLQDKTPCDFVFAVQCGVV